MPTFRTKAKGVTVSKSPLFILLLSLGLSANAQAESKMREALADAKISKPCQNKLIRIADYFIGKKRHRILEKNVSNSTTFHAFVLLSYNDQDTHMSFTATETKTGCQINMRESYELPANCMDARNSIFKRWAMIGKLNDKTIVMRYDHPRKKATLIADENARAMGFLTQTRRGEACLITKQQQNIPEPPKKEEE